MFLFNHALVVDMLVDAPETPSFAPIVAVRRSIFAKHITASMVKPLKNGVGYWSYSAGRDGSVSLGAWRCHVAVDDVFVAARNNVMEGACCGGHRELAEVMIQKGANDWNGGLYQACKGGQWALAERMIEKGAEKWSMGLRGTCIGGHRELTKLMVKRGAIDWNNALVDACRGGHRDLAEVMIERGADDWMWSLPGACIRGHQALAELMIENGAHECWWCGWRKTSGTKHTVRPRTILEIYCDDETTL